MQHAFVQPPEKTPYGKALLGLNNGKISAFLFLTHQPEKMLDIFHKKFPNSVEIKAFEAAFGEFQTIADDIFKNRKAFFDKIELHGTDFQKSVWLELMKLDCVVSYQQIAKNIGTNGVRAVASAIANNPIHYIIPCHLVIRSDGSLGKFAGGVELKRRLIEEETASH